MPEGAAPRHECPPCASRDRSGCSKPRPGCRRSGEKPRRRGRRGGGGRRFAWRALLARSAPRCTKLPLSGSPLGRLAGRGAPRAAHPRSRSGTFQRRKPGRRLGWRDADRTDTACTPRSTSLRGFRAWGCDRHFFRCPGARRSCRNGNSYTTAGRPVFPTIPVYSPRWRSALPPGDRRASCDSACARRPCRRLLNHWVD